MSSSTWTRICVLFVLALMVVVSAGCAGADDDTDGQTGNQDGQEQPNESLEIELVNQWLESGHSKVVGFAAAEEGCKNCHDGATFVTTGGGFVPRISVESSPTTETAERDWVVATDCRVCHTGPGVDVAERGSIDIPGKEVEAGTGALCISCHNGWHGPGKSQEGGQRAPHSSVQGDMVFASNVATITGATIDVRNAHQDVQDVCVGCHVTGLAVPGSKASDDAPPSHTFAVEADEDTCSGEDCHENDPLTEPVEEDLDGDNQTEPYQTEIEGLMASLKSAIESKAGGTFQSSGGDIVFAEGATPDDAAYAAAYNYLFVEDDGSRGVHSPTFTTSLLQATIDSLDAQ